MRRPALIRRVLLGLAAATFVAAPLVGATPAAASTQLSCPGGSYNLCIPAQGANEGVTGTAGSVVRAGYDFSVPGSDTTTVVVNNAYEQLTISCAGGATPTQPSIMVPMPDATYTAPFPQSQGWVPTGDQSSTLSYEGSFTLGNYCNGGTIDVGQPGQMLFAAEVQSNGTSQLNFRSHYNDGALSKSGSWSATTGVKPGPIPTQTIAGHIYLCSNGTQTTTEVSGGTLGATGPTTVPTGPNPLGPVSVPAGSYTMTETNPSGYQLAADCGTTSNTQTVVVPSGGAGVGIFYVEPIPTCPSGSGFRQATSAYHQGVTSISATLSSTPSGGDLLIADVQIAEGGATTTSVTDGSLIFTLRKTVIGPSPDDTEVTIWTAMVPCGVTPGSTITATASNKADMGIAVMEYAGLSGAIDGFSSASAFTPGTSTTTVNSGPGATANAGDLVLGFEADSGWQVHLGADTSDGYTSRVNVQNNPVAEFLVQDQTAAASGIYNAKATITYTASTPGDLAAFGFSGVPYVMGTIVFAHS